MGYHYYQDVLAGISALELSIHNVYKSIKLGTGIAVAEKIISDSLNEK